MTDGIAPRDRTLATAVDVHGLLVTLERDVDPTGAAHGVHLTMSGTTAAFDPLDETQHAGLVALHDALGALLGASPGWLVSRLDREVGADVELNLPDEFALADNVFTLPDGDRVRIVFVSRVGRVLYVRPEPTGDHR